MTSIYFQIPEYKLSDPCYLMEAIPHGERARVN